jgi:hypothetical protein
MEASGALANGPRQLFLSITRKRSTRPDAGVDSSGDGEKERAGEARLLILTAGIYLTLSRHHPRWLVGRVPA